MTRSETASYLLAAAFLLIVLRFGLLAALLSGLMVHETVLLIAPWLRRQTGLGQNFGKAIALVMLSAVISLLIAVVVIAAAGFLVNGQDSLLALIEKMTDVVESARLYLPAWATAYLPANTAGLQALAVDALKNHAWEIQKVGQEIGRTLVHILIGMIIGGLVLFAQHTTEVDRRPLARALVERCQRLAGAFRRVVFAQIRISALNTVLTALYLTVLLPRLGIELPLVKTLIAVTFIAGLLPVIGNIISNTVIVVVSLSVSAGAAIGSLVFLIAIHKLEYFVNARIIGGRINARAYEMLTCMLVMEVLFGVSGLIAAPILYAFVKDELTQRRLV